MYTAKCGLALKGGGHTAKFLTPILETEKPILLGEEYKKVNPPKDCDPKCLHKRRYQTLGQVDPSTGELRLVKAWRCRFTRKGDTNG